MPSCPKWRLSQRKISPFLHSPWQCSIPECAWAFGSSPVCGVDVVGATCPLSARKPWRAWSELRAAKFSPPSSRSRRTPSTPSMPGRKYLKNKSCFVSKKKQFFLMRRGLLARLKGLFITASCGDVVERVVHGRSVGIDLVRGTSVASSRLPFLLIYFFEKKSEDKKKTQKKKEKKRKNWTKIIYREIRKDLFSVKKKRLIKNTFGRIFRRSFLRKKFSTKKCWERKIGEGLWKPPFFLRKIDSHTQKKTSKKCIFRRERESKKRSGKKLGVFFF